MWIGLHEPTEEEFDSIRSEFDLHPLAVEDAIKAHQRPKLEVYGDLVFVVLKTARYVDPTRGGQARRDHVFLGDDFVITVRHGEASALHGVRKRLEDDPDLLRTGPGRCCTRSSTASSTTTSRRSTASRQDVDEVEAQVFSPTRDATPPSASTSSSARCSSSSAPWRR